jgi:hypothetical protein
MDVKDKQRAAIEFLLLEGCVGDEIARHLQSVDGEDASSKTTDSDQTAGTLSKRCNTKRKRR